MQKAMFLMECYKKGILSEIDSGYILTLNYPDLGNISTRLDPYRIEMISYSGVKSIQQTEAGLEFLSAGRKTLCLIEPANYPMNYVEPSMRSTSSTEHIPFRFRECNIRFTKDRKYRILIPDKPVDYYDAFTVEYPSKGDICVLYFVFDDNVDEVVLPYIRDNITKILGSISGLQNFEAKKISREFVLNVQKYQIARI
jgi:hypothetical protein